VDWAQLLVSRPATAPAVHAAAVAAPRLLGRGNPLHRAGPQHHPRRRHALRRQPPRRTAGRSATDRRGSAARARARSPGGGARREAVAAVSVPHRIVMALLLVLAALYAACFGGRAQWIALSVFAGPRRWRALRL